MYLFFHTILLFFSVCFAQEITGKRKPCESLKELTSFKTRFLINLSSKSYYAEEIVIFDGNRTRGQTNLYFEQELSQLFYASDQSNIIQYKDNGKICQTILLSDFVDHVPIYQNENEMVIGSSALWKQALQQKTEFEQLKEIVVVRGVQCIQCQLKVDNLLGFKNATLNVYLHSDQWKVKLHSDDNMLPFGFKLLYYTEKMESFSVDYFTFQPLEPKHLSINHVHLNPDTVTDNFWYPPNYGCPPSDQAEIAPNLSLNGQYTFTLLCTSKPGIEALKRISIDANEQLVRTDEMSDFFYNLLDISRGTIINVKRTTCDVKVADENTMNEELFSYPLVPYLLQPDAMKRFLKIGQSYFADELCDVYEFVDETSFKSIKIITTIFLIENKKRRPILVRVDLRKQYLVEKLWNKEISETYTVQDFKNRFSHKTKRSLFNFLNCNKDIQKSEEAVLFFSLKNHTNLYNLRDYQYVFDTAIGIINKVDSSVWTTIKDITLHIHQKNVDAIVEFNDAENPSWYFEKISDLDLFKSMAKEHTIEKLSDCQLKSLQNSDSIGILFCEDFECYDIKNESGRNDRSTKKNLKDKSACKAYKKIENLIGKEIHIRTANHVITRLKNYYGDKSNVDSYIGPADNISIHPRFHLELKERLPYTLVAKGAKLPTTTETWSMIVSSPADCYQICLQQSDDNKNCNIYSTCENGYSKNLCIFSFVNKDELESDYNGNAPILKKLTTDSMCDTFKFSIESMLYHKPDIKFRDLPLKTFSTKMTVEQCAEACLKYEPKSQKSSCRSVVLCNDDANSEALIGTSNLQPSQTGNCQLQHRSLLSSVVNTKKDNRCDVYSLSSLFDYQQVPYSTHDDLHSFSIKTLDECATHCSLTSGCNLIAFCPSFIFKKESLDTRGYCFAQTPNFKNLNYSKKKSQQKLETLSQCTMFRRRSKPIILNEELRLEIISTTKEETIKESFLTELKNLLTVRQLIIYIICALVCLLLYILISKLCSQASRKDNALGLSIKYDTHNENVNCASQKPEETLLA